MRYFLFFLLLSIGISSQVTRHRKVILMGSRFDITIVDKDSLSSENKIDIAINEIRRIENLISEWQENTIISEVNRNAGIRPVKVDKEVFDLTKNALKFSQLSNGAFDISIASMDKIWKFDGSIWEMPAENIIKNAIRNVNYENIILDSVNSTIYLKNKGIKIGFGATGKAYSADKTKKLMQSLGVKAGIINASGDIATWGTQPNGKTWTIGITDPFTSGNILKIIKLKNKSIVTSGDYQKFIEIDGRRYSHIINPKTGYPSSGITSVTIIGDNAEIANGISTSIMVLGKKKGLEFAKKFPNYQYFIIEDNGNIIQSKGFGKK